MKKIARMIIPDQKNTPTDYSNFFRLNSQNKNPLPIVLVYDNEFGIKDKPINSLLKTFKIDPSKEAILQQDHHIRLSSDNHLYLLTHQFIRTDSSEIEDLFNDQTLKIKINNKMFDRNSKESKSHNTFGKHVFSQYINDNYLTVDFTNFKPMLNALVSIIDNS